MSTVEILGWFFLLPLLVYVAIVLFVYTPSWVRGPKYRPGLSWWAEPIWIGGADLEAAASADSVREGGGCSARW